MSFASVEAHRDIYGHPSGQDKKRFLKSVQYERGEPRILTVRDPAEHAVQRQALAKAFSARALRDQEDVIHEYLDLLVSQLGKLGEDGRKGVNVTAAYQWLTFDVIGDLAFGEPFGATEAASQDWIHGMLHWTIYTALQHSMKKDLTLRILLPYIWGAKLSAMRANSEKYGALARDKAERRIAMGGDSHRGRQDFFSHLIKNKKITADALIGNTQTLIVAGSETTATALTAITFLLLQHPACLAALQREIRGAFAAPAEVTGDATARCEYLHAVMEEGLRLSPPSAVTLPRDCPGAFIDGQWIPEGVAVGGELFVTARHPKYWQEPEAFKPERWLGDGFPGDDRRASQPFSMGPRACLGINLAYLEMRVTLAKIVLAYDWELETQGIEDWNAACKLHAMWQKPNLLVRFIPRAETSSSASTNQ
ncbi:unnamed protein product [Discula destructiva]